MVLLVFIKKLVFIISGKDKIIKEEVIFNEVDEKGIIPKYKNRLAKKDKENVITFFKRGEACLSFGKEDEAIKSFVSALSINPKHIESLHKLGVLYMHKQMYSSASAVFKELTMLKNDSKNFSHLGLALFNLNDFEEAKKAYHEAVKLDDKRPQRYVSLAQVYKALKQDHLALIALDKALDLDPKNIDYLLLKTDFLFEIDKFEDAKDMVRQILEIDPENQEAKGLLHKRRSV